MAAILRLKRKVNENPLEVIKAKSKKRKLSSSEDGGEEVEALFKLVGTVKEKDSWSEAVAPAPTRPTKRPSVFSSPSRKKRQRYTLVRQSEHDNGLLYDLEAEDSTPNDHRDVKINENTDPKETSPTPAQICPHGHAQDDEGSGVIGCNGVHMMRSKVEKPEPSEDDEYVYDVYQVENDVDFRALEKMLQFEAGEDDWLFDYREGADSDTAESEDSNAENHWKNEYPDEDSDRFYADVEYNCYDDLCERMDNLNYEAYDSADYDSDQDDPAWDPSKSYRSFKKSIGLQRAQEEQLSD